MKQMKAPQILNPRRRAVPALYLIGLKAAGRRFFFSLPALLACLILVPFARAQTVLPLSKGDRIVYVGNTLADRMQHQGWLETVIQSRFPEHELVFRDLGFS